MRTAAFFVIAATLAASGTAVTAQARPALSDADRAEIQQISDRLLRTLNACAAEEYAALFAPDGYFESGFRGRVQGREPLIALVRSERHCQPGAAPRAAGVATAMNLQPSGDGALGTATLPDGAGGFDERYARTAQGWRLVSRTVFTAKELTARAAPK